MMYENKNAAYDLNLFKDNTAEKIDKSKENKENRVVTLTREQLYGSRIRKHNPFKILIGGLSTAVVTIVVATIIMGQVRLTELTREINATKKALTVSQSTYTQLQMGIQSKMTTSEIETYAENKLGMTKAENAQKEFISLSEGDKAELFDEANKNFFQKIIEAITGLWS